MDSKIIVFTVLMILIILSCIDYYTPIKKLDLIYPAFRENLEVNDVFEVYDKDGKQTTDYKPNITNKNILELQDTIDKISYCDNLNELESINNNDKLFMNDNLYKLYEGFREENNFLYEDLYIVIFCLYIIVILFMVCD